jgi:hypothetical protein
LRIASATERLRDVFTFYLNGRIKAALHKIACALELNKIAQSAAFVRRPVSVADGSIKPRVERSETLSSAGNARPYQVECGFDEAPVENHEPVSVRQLAS